MQKDNFEDETSESNHSLNSGDFGIIRFMFTAKPELLKPGATVIFRENHIMGIGFVS